jgi:hypothetical protein
VNHRTTAGFWRRYHQLPRDIQELAKKNFERLKADPFHPSLHFKKIGKLWSVRVGLDYRALGLDKGDTVQWFWIGHHDEYPRIIKGS